MTNTSSRTDSSTILQKIRTIIWPVYGSENKKFIPMALMMFFILFNYSMLRSIKDGFIVTRIGAEALSFLKSSVVLPAAILFMLAYVKLCNVMNSERVFYTVLSVFILYFIIFTFLLYPNADLIHPDPIYIENLAASFPHFKWFIRILGNWSFASFYTMSELWGSIVLSLLFWQFANQVTTTSESLRFYPSFGLLGNLGLICTSQVLIYFIGQDVTSETAKVTNPSLFTPILYIAIINGICLGITYWWLNNKVLKQEASLESDDNSSGTPKKKKSKVKLSVGESLKMIFSSKYLGLIAMLVICYGVSINLVEAVWKDKIKALYPSESNYAVFMGKVQFWQGLGTMICMIIGSNLLRTIAWLPAAMLTPIMLLITGVGFFAFIIFNDFFIEYLSISSPILIGVLMGAAQNILSKATKYSLFDPTKEMAYIPLPDEVKSKGKAAVDVVGGRLGKSGGGTIQLLLFSIFPSFTLGMAAPYFAVIFFFLILLWILSVRTLGTEYTKKLNQKDTKQE